MTEFFNSIPPFLLWAFALFGAVFFVQLVFLCLPGLALALRAGKPAAVGCAEGVSVVVCAHNELGNLPKLIEALRAQKHPDFEIIIVDDRSNDDSYAYLLKLRNDYDNIKHVRVNENPDWMNPKKYALTLGIKAAKNDIVLLTDADCVPASPNWIAEMTAGLVGKKTIAIGYPAYAKSKGLLNLLIRFETFYAAVQYLGLALVGLPYMGVGRNLAYRKDVFFGQKGFLKHAKVMGGDDDLLINAVASRSNTSVAVSAGAATVSVPKRSFGAWYRQKKRHLSVGRFYKTQHKMVLGLWALSHTGFWAVVALLAFFIGQMPLPWLLVLGGGVLLRWVVLMVVWGLAAQRLNEKIHPTLFPLLDLFFVLYYPIFTVPALLARKIKWQ